MIIPIFSNIIVMAFYTMLNIGIIIVSPLNPLFPFLHTTLSVSRFVSYTRDAFFNDIHDTAQILYESYCRNSRSRHNITDRRSMTRSCMYLPGI